MVEWILLHKHRLTDLLHYLDDFITAGPPQSLQCAYNLNTTVSVCHRLGLPLHANKCVGPATSMTILGIELDFVNQVAHLPEDKLLALRELIQLWIPRRWCRKRELESLLGHLHHAAKVVWPERAFLRRCIDLLCCFRNKDHPVWINQEFRLDLQWWQHSTGFLAWSWVLAVSWHICCHRFAGYFGCSRSDWLWRLFSRSVVLWRLVRSAGQAIYRIPRTLSVGDCRSSLRIFVGKEACPSSFR